jgi:hypothetical protein
MKRKKTLFLIEKAIDYHVYRRNLKKYSFYIYINDKSNNTFNKCIFQSIIIKLAQSL